MNNISIDRAKKINGWMDDDELLWLGDQASKAKCIIEVGSAYGRSTAALADNIHDGVIYAVDTWQGSPASLDVHHKDFRLREGDEAYIQFQEKHWNFIKAGILVPLRMHSANAAALLQQKHVHADFIFIDADHDYEAVRADILNFLPLLKPTGVFAGHDYKHPHWPDVTTAVDEVFADAKNPVRWIWTR